MSQSQQAETSYLLAHTKEEIRRLEHQARFVESISRNLFTRAGIAPGMKVLDTGSGGGDLALLLAEYVGPEGSIVGVEQNPDMVLLANQRARAAGLSNLSFIAGDISTVELDGEFDAVVGRLILLYVRDKVATLQHLLEHLRPGGIVAFQELEFVSMGMTSSSTPLFTRAVNWLRKVFVLNGLDDHMGLNLYRLFLDAGLPEPGMELITTVGGGANWDGYYQLTAVLRSVLQPIIKTGVVSAEEVDIDTLEQRLRLEGIAAGDAITGIALVNAWAHKEPVLPA